MLPRALPRCSRVIRAGPSSRRAGAASFSTSCPSQLTSITPSRDELLNARLSQRHTQTALEAFHRDGLVVIEDVVSHEDIDRLNDVMVRDAHRLMARGKDGPFNYNLGNLQQSPPYDPDVFKRNIFVNPFATQVTSAILGGRPTMSFVSANTAVKAEEGQPVHSDADFEHPKIPFAAVVNVGLVDMSPTNGSTQVWLGTHRDTDLSCQEGAHGERASGRIRRDLLDERSEVSPPIQPTIKKGSIIIRDLRLWHAGMPNRTETIRVMLAMIHFAPWYRQRMTLRLPRALRPVLESDLNLGVAAEWVDEEVDHLQATYGNAFDFSQDE
ncbi:hypothetical protein JCM24511_07414 [Saitozyma sp. JCM 24511]|nr:hypothetical protein JCM24511_07414 [Saitozyma sp. JCM 24511]